VDLTPGRTTVRLSVELDPETRIADEFLAAAHAARGNRPDVEVYRNASVPISLGEIADLDEERFSNKAGSRGLWEPLSFPLQDGIGIFFLEPYDPDRIPVLFVYGAGGSPQNWRYFFDHLDRELYQPWFFFYPTGRRLDEVARWLDEGVALLHDHFTFRRMHVVAHSMGGLVARAFLFKHVRDRGTRYIETFVTLSRPWAGHQAAASGVARSPSVVPAWYDLAPGSEFLSGLFRNSLREYLDPYLLFSFRGSRTPILPASNDGVVSLESQLAPAAQAEALALYGFDDAHMEIVSDPKVFALVERLLRGDDK